MCFYLFLLLTQISHIFSYEEKQLNLSLWTFYISFLSCIDKAGVPGIWGGSFMAVGDSLEKRRIILLGDPGESCKMKEIVLCCIQNAGSAYSSYWGHHEGLWCAAAPIYTPNHGCLLLQETSPCGFTPSQRAPCSPGQNQCKTVFSKKWFLYCEGIFVLL